MTEPVPTTRRRYEVDALRVLATFLLIVFHTAMVFNPDTTFHLQNDDRPQFFGDLVGFIYRWHMPLFFLLAGIAAWYALKRRTGKIFAAERFRRLFVPLLVGMAVIVPPQVYLERISTTVATRQSPIDFDGSFFEFLPQAYNPVYPDGNLSWHHLWFLMYLFVYSLLLLPLFLWLRGAGAGFRTRVTGFLSRGWNVLLPAAVLAGFEALLRPSFPNNQDLVTDLANHANYPIVFLLGFLLVSDDRLDAAVDRVWKWSLGVGVLAGGLTLLGDLGDAGHATLRGFIEWTVIVGLIGLGRRLVRRPIPWVERFSEISLPFYIWHQTVIIVLAYWVIQWNAGPWAKYAAIAVPAFLIAWGLSRLVATNRVTRAMFGMRERTPQR